MQLVGKSCIHCQQRIAFEIEGQFCPKCHSPFTWSVRGSPSSRLERVDARVAGEHDSSNRKP